MKKYRDLVGQKHGMLTVLRRMDEPTTYGNRLVVLWECRCDCGNLAYRTAYTLMNENKSMCSTCASKYATERMRQSAGYVDGTQISRIKSNNLVSSNTSGARGVYYEKRLGKWRARLKFKGKLMDFGTYANFEDAVAARKEAEKLYFGEFLDNHE